MFLSINYNQFNKNNVIFSEKIKNNIIEGGDYFRTFYSTPLCTTNGLYMHFSFNNVKIEKYFDKVKCYFSKENNYNTIKQLKELENTILSLMPINTNSSKINEQLKNNFIKIFFENTIKYGKMEKIQLVLKISGIWSNNIEHGLAFRFYLINHLL